MRYGWVPLIFIGFVFSGCTSMKPVDVANPSEVTVDAALYDVAKGLNNFRKLGASTNTRYGLIVDEVTVTLKVTASANDSSKLVLDVANVKPTILEGGNVGVHAEQGGDSHGTRDNTIVVRLRNIYTAQLNAVGLKQKLGDNGTFGGDTVLMRPLIVPQDRYLAAPLRNEQSIDCARPQSPVEKFVCDKFRAQGQ